MGGTARAFLPPNAVPMGMVVAPPSARVDPAAISQPENLRAFHVDGKTDPEPIGAVFPCRVTLSLAEARSMLHDVPLERAIRPGSKPAR